LAKAILLNFQQENDKKYGQVFQTKEERNNVKNSLLTHAV
jgi:hypothetical protein